MKMGRQRGFNYSESDDLRELLIKHWIANTTNIQISNTQYIWFAVLNHNISLKINKSLWYFIRYILIILYNIWPQLLHYNNSYLICNGKEFQWNPQEKQDVQKKNRRTRANQCQVSITVGRHHTLWQRWDKKDHWIGVGGKTRWQNTPDWRQIQVQISKQQGQPESRIYS